MSHGFGGVDQVAEFFGVRKSDVLHKARTGEWPSYVISGRRVFDIDSIVHQLFEHSQSQRLDAIHDDAHDP